MSKLIDKLTRQRQNEPQPMGFMLSRPKEEKLRLILVADVAAENLEKLNSGLQAADAIMVDVTKADDLAVVEKANQTKETVATGGWLKTTTAAVLKKIVTAECDFVVFPGSAPVTLTKKEKLGRVLEVDNNLTDSLLRAAGELPIDAVIISGKNSEMALTLNRLMLLQRVMHLVNKPVLVAVPDNLTGPELQSLWDIGVSGLIVEVEDEKSGEKLAEMRKLIDKLDPPAFRKKSKASAILPRMQPETAQAEHEEEEEEEE